MVEMEEAGKIFMAGAILVLLVTTFVAFGAMFMVVFTGSLNTQSADASSTTEFTGVAATPYQFNAPIISVDSFLKSASIVGNNNTNTRVNQSVNLTIPIDSGAVNNGVNWSNVTIVFSIVGANATTNVTWINGTCNAQNKTWSSAGLQTYTDINSSCLTPGGNLVFYFANKTAVNQTAPNVTYVNVTYMRYVTNSAYTLQDSAGTVTPTASGYYKITYTYGAGGIDYTDAKTTLSSGVTTITQIPNWLGMIILVFVLIVIFLLLAAIAYVAKGMGGGRQ